MRMRTLLVNLRWTLLAMAGMMWAVAGPAGAAQSTADGAQGQAAAAPATTLLVSANSIPSSRSEGHASWQPATVEVYATFAAGLVAADATQAGNAFFTFSAQTAGQNPQFVTVHVPLASSEKTLVESRSCAVDGAGSRQMTVVAGVDEANFVPFAAAKDGAPLKDFRFELNKYLCRVIAMPFDCAGEPVELPKDLSQWRLAVDTSIDLGSVAPAALKTTDVTLTATKTAFDCGQG
jgi:hypothetical protein